MKTYKKGAMFFLMINALIDINEETYLFKQKKTKIKYISPDYDGNKKWHIVKILDQNKIIKCSHIWIKNLNDPRIKDKPFLNKKEFYKAFQIGIIWLT